LGSAFVNEIAGQLGPVRLSREEEPLICAASADTDLRWSAKRGQRQISGSFMPEWSPASNCTPLATRS